MRQKQLKNRGEKSENGKKRSVRNRKERRKINLNTTGAKGSSEGNASSKKKKKKKRVLCRFYNGDNGCKTKADV